ncbi:MAG: GTPase [Nanoarchaeota archaeon]
MPINAGYKYINAEKLYLNAKTLEEKINALEEMIRTAPKHKGSENLLAGLKLRLKKLREQQEKSKKIGKSSQKGIRKEGFQCVLLGLPNSGKSSLLAKLTNAKPKISGNPFTTKQPEIGTLDYESIKAQIVDLPSIGSEFFDNGIIHTADFLLLVIEKLEDLNKIIPLISKSQGKTLIVINKSDLLTYVELRKLQDKINSKRLNAIPISCYNNYNIDKLKEYILHSMSVNRVYTKEPHKSASSIPVILPSGSSVKDVAESILKGFSQRVKETRLTGPSSKFSNQKVGLSHILKDKDIVEFHTK